MEWPELLRRQAEVLEQYESWLRAGCVGAPPTPVEAATARGPVPDELRAHAAGLVARTAVMEHAVAAALAALRDKTGHPAPVRNGYEQRPMPRYLDAVG